MSEIGPSINEIILNPEKTSQFELELQDLVFLQEKNIGLRHVSSISDAKSNVENGFTGDALALGGIFEVFLKENPSLFEQNDEAKNVLSIFDKFKLPPTLEYMERFFNANQEEQIVTLAHQRIVSFIQDSFDMNQTISAERGKTSSSAILDTLKKSSSSFILVRSNRSGNYDSESYYGLGKLGKQHFDKENIVGVVFSDEISSDLQIQKTNPTSVVDDSFFDKMAESYYRSIVREIKEAKSVQGD